MTIIIRLRSLVAINEGGQYFESILTTSNKASLISLVKKEGILIGIKRLSLFLLSKHELMMALNIISSFKSLKSIIMVAKVCQACPSQMSLLSLSCYCICYSVHLSTPLIFTNNIYQHNNTKI